MHPHVEPYNLRPVSWDPVEPVLGGCVCVPEIKAETLKLLHRSLGTMDTWLSTHKFIARD